MVLPHEGGRVYISVHDQEFLRLKAEWKRKLAEAHPDRGATDLTFVRTRRQFERWLAEETKWYARFGLQPPETPKARSDADLSRALRLAGGFVGRPRKIPREDRSPAQRLVQLLSDGTAHSLTECAAVSGLSACAVRMAVKRLRWKGFDIIGRRAPATYQWVGADLLRQRMDGGVNA